MAPFTRLMIRVPEAYPLLGPFETTRPGLLVLDADGRRAASILMTAFVAKDADFDALTPDLVKKLSDACKVKVTERFVVQGDEKRLGTLAKTLAKREGVARATYRSSVGLVLRADVGTFTPEKLLELAGKGAVIIEPVPVQIRAGEADPGTVPGAWFRSGASRLWITKYLLDPSALPPSDVVAQRFTFFSIPIGGAAVKALRAPEGLKGVLAVVPNLEDDVITVVGRRGALDVPGLRAAFTASGAELDDEE